MNNRSFEALIDDVDSWFCNYFTLDNFDSNESLIDALYDTKKYDSSIMSDCFYMLVSDYKWPSCYIDEYYEAIMDQLHDDAELRLHKLSA